jgi:catechol 2,3-dioxygenase-like lactoylglutathione lyase family enzyme
MFSPRSAFSGFSVNDLARARQFYVDTLGLRVDTDGVGLKLHLPGGSPVFVYPKPDHQPATFTILNFVVDDIAAAVQDLVGRGVQFDRYSGLPADENGVMRVSGSPPIAWFKDPAGNVLSVIEE